MISKPFPFLILSSLHNFNVYGVYNQRYHSQNVDHHTIAYPPVMLIFTTNSHGRRKGQRYARVIHCIQSQRTGQYDKPLSTKRYIFAVEFLLIILRKS